MVPSVRRAALTTTTIALLPSFLDIVSTLLSPFPGLASQRLCHRTYHRVMPSRLLYTPADDYATLVSARIRKTKGRKKEKERVCGYVRVLYNRNAAQKVELQFGRAQISRNDR